MTVWLVVSVTTGSRKAEISGSNPVEGNFVTVHFGVSVKFKQNYKNCQGFDSTIFFSTFHEVSVRVRAI